MRTWLHIDATFLCHRARHSTGGLSYGGEPTGVLHGVLREIDALFTRYSPEATVWAFDCVGERHRQTAFPGYKSSRAVPADESEEDRAERLGFYREIERLYAEVLPRLGFKNVFRVPGYEADDILAASCKQEADPDLTHIIVTADKDLLQCITDRVVCFNPITKKAIGMDRFVEEWRVHPAVWANVKALAGCAGDDVPGIRGVGEKTAAKWYSGALKPGSRMCRLIESNLDVLTRNLPIVRLPWPGLQLPEILPDGLVLRMLKQIRQEYGIQQQATLFDD